MYQRDESSWRRRNEALKGKVFQDVGGSLTGQVTLNVFPLPCPTAALSPLRATQGKVDKQFPKLARYERYAGHLP